MTPDFTYLTGHCRIEHWGDFTVPYHLFYQCKLVARFKGFAYAVRYAEKEFGDN